MKFAAILLFAAVFCVTLAPGFAPAAKKTVPKRTTGSKKTAVARKTGTSNSTTTRKTAASRKGTAARRPVIARQATPTSDRYKEIQQALATKGYLKSEPTGVWDANSVDAMKRFQADQKQDPTGKLTAASLIDLGLGPKHEMTPTPVKGPGEAVPEPPKVAPAPQP